MDRKWEHEAGLFLFVKTLQHRFGTIYEAGEAEQEEVLGSFPQCRCSYPWEPGENSWRLKSSHWLICCCFCHTFTLQEAYPQHPKLLSKTQHRGGVARAAAGRDAETHQLPPPCFQKSSLKLPKRLILHPSSPRPVLAALPLSGGETPISGPLEAEMSSAEIFWPSWPSSQALPQTHDWRPTLIQVFNNLLKMLWKAM